MTTKWKEAFHRSVAKHLFASKGAQPDMQPPITELCTRIKNLMSGDWEKLKRLMKYLNGMRKKKIVLSARNLQVIKWFVDASFAVHLDFKSHTRAAMTIEQGAIQNMTRKQKLVTKSSTDAELVVTGDMSVLILWTELFMEE